MNICPVANWKQQRPESLAFPGMTYREFDEVIQGLCGALKDIPEKILAFVPEQSILDLAFFFAAWRMGKAVYPISFRHPEQAIKMRLEHTGAIFVKPSQLQSTSCLEINAIDETILATYIETSSASKIVCHQLRSHLISARACADALDLKPGDTYCLNLPLFHISGIALMLRTFVAGATVMFHRLATHISMVPTQLFRLIETDTQLPKLKCLLIGGAPLSKSLYDAALKRDLPIYCTYGMTESGSMALLKPPDGLTTILPHIELKFVEGEIHLQGDSLFHHYFGQEPRSGWFATRDIGQINSQGEIEIVGRKDRQFISGGENIIPEEIEQALLQIPEVIEARVEPEADVEFGMRPIAKLYCKSEITTSSIEHHLEALLPRYKIPKKILISTQPVSTKQSSLTKIFI